MKKETQPRTWYKGPPAPQGAAASGAPRTWHSGPPPHVGWWNASVAQDENVWRWWNGVQWSLGYFESSRAAFIKIRTIPKRLAPDVRWSDYYPEGARVPRVDPANPYITPMLPALNAGSLYAWEEAGRRMHVTARSKEWATWALAQEPISMPKPDPDLCVPRIDAATCTTQEMPRTRAPLSVQLPEACSFGDGMVVAYDTSAKPTPEEDEAWRASSTGQRTGTPVPQNPERRDLAGVSTRDLMKELFRRFQE